MDLYPDDSHFTDLPRPLGKGALTIGVGPLSLGIEGLSDALSAAAKERYAPFLITEPPLHRVTLYPGNPTYLDPSPDHYLRLEETALTKGKCLASHDFAASRRGSASVLRVSAPENVKVTLVAVENYLRWVVADLALDYRAFVIHAAGLARNGSAYVFFGPSGAGKSTVTELSGNCRVLSDDLVMLRRSAEGWLAATTPFAGTFPQGAKDREEYPLKGLFRLIQGDVDELTPLSPGLATGKVFACCPFVSDPAVRADSLLPLVEQCCKELLPMELTFRKASSFWKLIEEEVEYG